MVSRLVVLFLLLSVGKGQAQVVYDSLGSTQKQIRFTGSASGEMTLHLTLEALPIAGTWTTGPENIVLFKPLFPLKEGHPYLLKVDNEFIRTIELAETIRQAPRVIRIHPESDTVPANLLKVYILFDQPMASGHATDHIQLINHATGKEEAAAFLQLEQELWTYSGDTLTMWLDPGRIKRDLIPNEKLGNPLTEGNHYSLRIKQGWPAQNGTSLTSDYIHEFYVSGMDRTRPDAASWNISTPKAETTDPLKIQFTKTLDMGSLVDAFIIGHDGKTFPYHLLQKSKDREVWLVPESNWIKGEYTLRIAPRVEDLAGNRLDRLFDEEISEGENKWVDQRSFEIK